MIYDQGYIVTEASEGGDVGYRTNVYDGLYISLKNKNYAYGTVNFGGYNKPNVDVMKLSFVVETVDTDEHPPTMLDEDQVWYRESSASLLENVANINGPLRVRELHASEKVQMNKFKRSPVSKKMRLVYQNDKVQLQTSITIVESSEISRPSQSIYFIAQRKGNPGEYHHNSKSATITGYEGKSFVLKEVPGEGDCPNSFLDMNVNCWGLAIKKL